MNKAGDIDTFDLNRKKASQNKAHQIFLTTKQKFRWNAF